MSSVIDSEVVSLTTLESGIAVITLDDRENRNTFSEGIITGLIGAFEKIASNPNFRVVIITGYDNYFCSGGDKDTLLMLYEGKGRFSDRLIYSLPLECKIPVISAMQGHAIGGGFILGMFADFVVMSRESVYTTNFMKYGFTPGAGSTLILREKIGLGLAQEMLTTAENYRGGELAERGIPFPVLPRKDVFDRAVKLAKSISDKPRHSLITLKDHVVSDLRKKLPGIVSREEAMHDETFHRPEVKGRIDTLFGN